MKETKIVFDVAFSVWEWLGIILVAIILSDIGRRK